MLPPGNFRMADMVTLGFERDTGPNSEESVEHFIILGLYFAQLLMVEYSADLLFFFSPLGEEPDSLRFGVLV